MSAVPDALLGAPPVFASHHPPPQGFRGGLSAAMAPASVAMSAAGPCFAAPFNGPPMPFKPQQQQQQQAHRSLAATPMQYRDQISPQRRFLEDAIARRLQEVAITAEDVHIAQTCLKELARTVAKLGFSLRIRPFGSIANGFARHGSDIDATCSRFDKDDRGGPPPSSQDLLDHVVALMRDSADFVIAEEIKCARIPLLKLRYKGTIDVDLSFQNVVPLKNTQLLRSYVSFGFKVRDVGVLVKLWAEAAGVLGATKGYLSAYSFTLMVVYFLQVEPAIRLPVLATSMFKGEVGVPPAVQAMTWHCGLDRSELLLRFFHFYAQEFQWGTEVISIRVGRRCLASNEAFTELRGRFTRRLHIEDPFLQDRNLHCVLWQDQEYTFYQRIQEAYEILQRGSLPEGLWPGEEASQRWSPTKDASRSAAVSDALQEDAPRVAAVSDAMRRQASPEDASPNRADSDKNESEDGGGGGGSEGSAKVEDIEPLPEAPLALEVPIPKLAGRPSK